MSLDRYLAINNLAGCRTRNKKNAFRTVYLLWAFVLLTNLPHLFLWEDYSYSIESKNRTGKAKGPFMYSANSIFFLIVVFDLSLYSKIQHHHIERIGEQVRSRSSRIQNTCLLLDILRVWLSHTSTLHRHHIRSHHA